MDNEQKETTKVNTGYPPVKVSEKHIARALDLVGWYMARDFPKCEIYSDNLVKTVTISEADGYLEIRSYC